MIEMNLYIYIIEVGSEWNSEPLTQDPLPRVIVAVVN